MFLVRQGDVLVYAAPKGAKPAAAIARDNGRIVLAYGEVTGHAHAIHDRDAELFALAGTDTDDRFLRIMAKSGVSLVHEEHSTITLPAGDFIVRRQREYVAVDMAPLRVAD